MIVAAGADGSVRLFDVRVCRYASHRAAKSISKRACNANQLILLLSLSVSCIMSWAAHRGDTCCARYGSDETKVYSTGSDGKVTGNGLVGNRGYIASITGHIAFLASCCAELVCRVVIARQWGQTCRVCPTDFQQRLGLHASRSSGMQVDYDQTHACRQWWCNNDPFPSLLANMRSLR